MPSATTPWLHHEGVSVDGQNVSVLDAKTPEQLERCKEHCTARGYSGFTTWRGKAFFRDAPRATLVCNKKRTAGSDLYIAPPPAPPIPTPTSAPPAPQQRKPSAPASGASSSNASPPLPLAAADAPRPKKKPAAKKKKPSQQAQPAARSPAATAPRQALGTEMGDMMQALEALGVAGGVEEEEPYLLPCSHCNRLIHGEHLLVEVPGRGELAVHEECYEASLPTCAWCRAVLSDSYVLFKGVRYGVVCLHEGCRAAFEEANRNTTSAESIRALSKPSDARRAGKDTDRLFISQCSEAEALRELARRGLRCSPVTPLPALRQALREHWDDPVVS